MAFTSIPLTSSSWTLVGNNVTSISFQNQSQNPLYLAVTVANTAPAANTVGWMYDYYSQERKANVATFSTAGGTYVWARAAGVSSRIVVES